MLRSVSEIINYTLAARDEEIGRCKDFLFDDQLWTIRYMVADTGKWLPGKKVLISPLSLEEPEWATRRFPVNLTKEQIENAPSLEEDAPVSRLYEKKHFDYFRWPYYWAGGNIWGPMSYPYIPAPPPPDDELEKMRQEQENINPEESHLRSCMEVKGYHIQAEDGEIGHVEDFIVEDDVWTIRYMIIDTRNWLPGRKVLVSPGWISSLNWAENKVGISLTVEAIKNGPEFDPSKPVNREYETRLYDFYGRPKYWADEFPPGLY
jgi:hypothetical protein